MSGGRGAGAEDRRRERAARRDMPRERDDRAARESRRRATAWARARGQQ